MRDRPLMMLFTLLCTAILLSGCNLSQATFEPVPTATTVIGIKTTPIPTLSRLYEPASSNDRTVNAVSNTTRNQIEDEEPVITTPTPEATCVDDTAHAKAQHTISAVMDYETKRIEARHRLIYTNRTGETLMDFVINIEPNRWLEVFTLESVILTNTSDGDVSPAYNFTGRRLYFELTEPLEVGCSITVDLVYSIDVPPIRTGVDAFKGFFGHSPRQVNLGHWLPSAAERINGEWITRQAMFVGEQEVLGKADWDVTFELQNAPESVVIAQPGDVEEKSDNRWRYTLENARDFSMSLGDGFRIQKAQAESGVSIEVYTFADAEVVTDSGKIDGAGHSLNVALRSTETYETLFGAYPYERMLIVQGDFPDGMEFSGMVFVSSDWFKSYVGDPASFLTLITVHEVAHQWWYASVGNDPATTPWLDEALSTYCEYIFLEEYYPSLTDWWWDFRVRTHSPQGFVDSTIYEFTSIRAYINAVYLRGVIMLNAIRNDIGTEAFFELLRKYAESGAGQVATPRDFWGLFTEEQLAKTSVTRNVFLRRPDVMGTNSVQTRP